MSLAQTFSVLVDDTDPAIQYTGGPWFQDNNATDNQGNWGHPLFNTLHGTNQSGVVTFLFNGTKVMPAASFRNTTAGATPPSWTCLVDGTPIQINPYNIPINRYPLCETDTLSDGQHNLTVIAQASPGHQFWFDYVQYAPSRDVLLDNADIYIDSSDPAVEYGAGWAPYASGELTATSGASVKLSFHGVAIIWVGIIPTNSSTQPATFSYTVDGNAAAGTVTLSGPPSPSSPDIYNQYMFQTAPLPVGVHTLEVVYNGDVQSAPLVLDDFIVLNRTTTAAVTTTTATSSTSPTGMTSPSASHTGASNHVSLGVLLGAILGSLVLVGLVIALIFVYRCDGYRSYRKAAKHIPQEDGRA